MCNPQKWWYIHALLDQLNNPILEIWSRSLHWVVVSSKVRHLSFKMSVKTNRTINRLAGRPNTIPTHIFHMGQKWSWNSVQCKKQNKNGWTFLCTSFLIHGSCLLRDCCQSLRLLCALPRKDKHDHFFHLLYGNPRNLSLSLLTAFNWSLTQTSKSGRIKI